MSPPPPQNGFRERKVYQNFVLILYNFVHRVPNFVHHYLLRYRQFKFGGLVTCSLPKCSFNIKNWIIIFYSFCTILYIKFQILYTVPSCAMRNSNLGRGLVKCSSPKCSFNIKNWIIILHSFCTILYTKSQICTSFPLQITAIKILGWGGRRASPPFSFKIKNCIIILY